MESIAPGINKLKRIADSAFSQRELMCSGTRTAGWRIVGVAYLCSRRTSTDKRCGFGKNIVPEDEE